MIQLRCLQRFVRCSVSFFGSLSDLLQELQEQQFNLPLFLLGDMVVFPKSTLPLHVFEPRSISSHTRVITDIRRYKLMMRRVLEGGRRFGIAPSFGDQISPIGTSLMVENHLVFPGFVSDFFVVEIALQMEEALCYASARRGLELSSNGFKMAMQSPG